MYESKAIWGQQWQQKILGLYDFEIKILGHPTLQITHPPLILDFFDRLKMSKIIFFEHYVCIYK